MPARTAEAALVLRAARESIRPDDGSPVDGSVDWQAVETLAQRHLLTGPLFRMLKQCPQARADVVARLGAKSAAATALNLRLTSRLPQVLSLFETAAVPVLLFKGPVAALDAYGSLSQRPFADLDLLVHPSDSLRAIELLVAGGFRELFSLTPQWWPRFVKRFSEMPFRDASADLDLHWKLLDPLYSWCPDDADIWQDVRTVDVNGRTVQTMSLTMTVKFLCLHAAKHDWDRIGWLLDLAGLVSRHSEIDWNGIASDRRMGRAAPVTLELMNRWFGAPIPEPIRSRLDPKANDIADAVERRVLSLDESVRDRRRLPWRAEGARSRATSRERWQLMYGTLFLPSVKEWMLFPLPRWLSPLYAIVRPVRLAWRALGRFWGTGTRRSSTPPLI